MRKFFGGAERDSLEDRIRGMASTLLNLEVNTIVKAGMSAEKMPAVPIALHQLAGIYADFLRCRLPAEWCDFDEATLYRDDAGTNGAATFVALAEAADTALDAIDADLDRRSGADCAEEWIALLERIRTNSRQLARHIPAVKAGLDGLSEKLIGGTCEETSDALQDLNATLPVPPDFTVLLRKAWDIGAEMVILQTCLQIDGDAITRVSPAVFAAGGPAGLASDAERAFVSGMHHAALGAATAQWKSLFEVLGGLVNGLARMLFPRL